MNFHFHNCTANFYNAVNSVQHQNHNRKRKRCVTYSSDSSDEYNFLIFRCVEYCVCSWLFVRLSCYKNVKFERWKWNWLITELLLVLLTVTIMDTCFATLLSLTLKELLKIKWSYLSPSKILCIYFPHLKARKTTPQKIFELGKYDPYCTLYCAITSTYNLGD